QQCCPTMRGTMMQTDPRDELAEAVQYGRISPQEADDKLKLLGLPPLAPQPNPADYDPMREVWWTLPMTVAWIAWRTSADVRDDPIAAGIADRKCNIIP